MDSITFFEDEILANLHHSFIARFSLEQSAAAELALEVMEVFKLSDTGLSELKQMYLN